MKPSLLLALLLSCLVYSSARLQADPPAGTVDARTGMEADLRALAESLRAYKQTAGQLPTTEQGLDVLVRCPIGARAWSQLLEQLPVDAWGRAYCYRIAPDHPSGYDLFSFGPDGVESADDIHLP